jgi:acyl-CoA thioesterase-1
MKLPNVAAVTLLCGVACSESHPVSPAPDAVAGMAGASSAVGGSGGGTTAEADAASGPATPALQHASPIISRGATVFSSPAGGAAVVDGSYHNGGWSAGNPTSDAPAWVALQLSRGPSRLLVVWDDGGTYNYQDPTTAMVYGLPRGYRIEVSSDSTNGSDGTWASRTEVTDNDARTRGHAIDFSGQSWVKLVVTAAPPNAANGVSIAELDVHDISSAPDPDLPEDTWLFMGDSITAFAYDRALIHQPSFAAGINALVPSFFPAMLNAGIGGEKTTEALERITQTLALNPNYHFVILGYGTNDAANNQIAPAVFKANLQTLIDRVRAAGRVPLIPHIPVSMDGNHASIPLYNAVIDELTTENQLLVGADLYGYFSANAALFSCPPCANGRMTDNLHPNDDGLKGMNAVWTSALRGLYPGAATP